MDTNTTHKTPRQIRSERKAHEKAMLRNAKKASKNRKIIERLDNRYVVNNISTLYFKPCVYFLKYNYQVVYIGETTSLMNRISQHINENVKIFDSFSFEVFNGSDAERKAYEAELINGIKPFYNKVHVGDKKIPSYGLRCDKTLEVK